MTYHSKSKIVEMGKVVADGHGHFTLDLKLADGTEGYYPNTEEFLNKLKVGMIVYYKDTKHFAGRTKINGLTFLEKKKQNKVSEIKAIITSTSPMKKGENGSYYKDIETEDGVKGIFFSKELSEVEQLITGSLISYKDIKKVKGKDVFIGVEKLRRFSVDDRRQLSIVRQSTMKLAVECLKTASPKGRWINKDGSFDADSCFKEVVELTERFIEYVTVE